MEIEAIDTDSVTMEMRCTHDRQLSLTIEGTDITIHLSPLIIYRMFFTMFPLYSRSGVSANDNTNTNHGHAKDDVRPTSDKHIQASSQDGRVRKPARKSRATP